MREEDDEWMNEEDKGKNVNVGKVEDDDGRGGRRGNERRGRGELERESVEGEG